MLIKQTTITMLLALFCGIAWAKPYALIEQNPLDAVDESILEPLGIERSIGHIGLKPLEKHTLKSAESARIEIVVESRPQPSLKPSTAQEEDASETVANEATTTAISESEPEDKSLALTVGKPRTSDGVTWPHSVALGKPFRGYLYNPVQLKNSERLAVRRHKNYGTAETITAIEMAVNAVHDVFPDTPRLPVGNISRKAGGRFPPHKSHQNGRDADIAYFLRVGHHPKHLKLANSRTIDAGRTWVFLESMVKRGELEMAFIDYRLQKVLYRYATRERGWTPEQMKTIMAYPQGRGNRTALIRHLRGHADHMHVRFHAPDSIAAIDELIARYGNKILKPMPVFTRVRSGDSLWKIARRHRSSVAKLRRWNGRKKTRILRPGQRLIIGWRRPTISELKGSS